MFQQPGPRPVGLPPPGEPLTDRLPRPITRRQIPPRSPCPQPPQHPVDHLPMILPGPPPAIQHRQQRSNPLPRHIRQLTTTRHKINYQGRFGPDHHPDPARTDSTDRWSAGSADHTMCRPASSPNRSGCRRRGGRGGESAIPTRPESRRAPPSGRPQQPIHRRPCVPPLVAGPSSVALTSAQHRWVTPPQQPSTQQSNDHLSDRTSALVAGVGLGAHIGVEAELFGDALGTHSGPVAHAARADDARTGYGPGGR